MKTREILFRGKKVDAGIWIEGYFYKGDYGHGCYIIQIIDQCIQTEIEVIPESVGQFTGLLDKNGTKIFEGDLLENVDKYGKIVCQCIYDCNSFKFLSQNLGVLNANFINYFTIIGNIHDNPGLL